MLPKYVVSLGQLTRENQSGEVIRLLFILNLARKRLFKSICQWKAYASLSKNTFHDSTSASALFLICS